MIFVSALILLFQLSLDAAGQDILTEKSRGGRIPPVNKEIIEILNATKPSLSDNTIIISLRLMRCKSDEFISPSSNQSAIAKYFAPYYPAVDNLKEASAISLVGRVNISPRHAGFLIQGLGPESSAVIDLWTYDIAKQIWLGPIEASWRWGDAGEYVYLDSLLTDVNRDGRKDIVKRGKRGEYSFTPGTPSRVDFEGSVVRLFTSEGFRNHGSAPRQFRNRLATIDREYEKCLQENSR